MKEQRTNSCPICGKPVTNDKHAHWKYCSNECYLMANQEKQEKRREATGIKSECPVCGKIIKLDGTRRKYCSDACRTQAIMEKRRVKRQPPEEKICPMCGKAIPLDSRSSRRMYCSPECSNAAIQQAYYRRRENEIRYCQICGVQILPGVHRSAYCSDECARLGKIRRNEEARQLAQSNTERRCRTCGNLIPPGTRRHAFCSADCAENYRCFTRESDDREKWDPKKETYAEFQIRTFVHPDTRKTLEASVRIAPKRRKTP